jgi:hypothetical protein
LFKGFLNQVKIYFKKIKELELESENNKGNTLKIFH